MEEYWSRSQTITSTHPGVSSTRLPPLYGDLPYRLKESLRTRLFLHRFPRGGIFSCYPAPRLSRRLLELFPGTSRTTDTLGQKLLWPTQTGAITPPCLSLAVRVARGWELSCVLCEGGSINRFYLLVIVDILRAVLVRVPRLIVFCIRFRCTVRSPRPAPYLFIPFHLAGDIVEN